MIKDQEVQVDKEDWILLSRHNWNIVTIGNCLYCYTVLARTNVFMHQLVFGPTKRNTMIDHKDGNGLNNTKENLREVTNSINQQNRHWKPKGTSKYRGVFWASRNKRWQAQIKINGKTKYLGQFKEEVDAAKAYDIAAKQLFGNDCYTNEEKIGLDKAKGIDWEWETTEQEILDKTKDWED